MVTEKSLKNLKPFQKGVKQDSPRTGRPRKKAWIEELDAFASSPAQFKPLLKRVIKEHPVDVLYYLMGKPKEMVVIDQTLKAEITTQEVVELAAQARAELQKQLTEKKP